MKTLIRKLLEKLNTVPKDKYQHFAVGTALAAVTLLAAWALFAGAAALLCAGDATQAGTMMPAVPDCSLLVLRRWASLLLSAGVVLAAALVKERRIDARADLRDLLATLAGGAAVWTAAIAAYLLTA